MRGLSQIFPTPGSDAARARRPGFMIASRAARDSGVLWRVPVKSSVTGMLVVESSCCYGGVFLFMTF